MAPIKTISFQEYMARNRQAVVKKQDDMLNKTIDKGVSKKAADAPKKDLAKEVQNYENASKKKGHNDPKHKAEQKYAEMLEKALGKHIIPPLIDFAPIHDNQKAFMQEAADGVKRPPIRFTMKGKESNGTPSSPVPPPPPPPPPAEEMRSHSPFRGDFYRPIYRDDNMTHTQPPRPSSSYLLPPPIMTYAQPPPPPRTSHPPPPPLSTSVDVQILGRSFKRCHPVQPARTAIVQPRGHVPSNKSDKDILSKVSTGRITKAVMEPRLTVVNKENKRVTEVEKFARGYKQRSFSPLPRRPLNRIPEKVLSRRLRRGLTPVTEMSIKGYKPVKQLAESAKAWTWRAQNESGAAVAIHFPQKQKLESHIKAVKLSQLIERYGVRNMVRYHGSSEDLNGHNGIYLVQELMDGNVKDFFGRGKPKDQNEVFRMISSVTTALGDLHKAGWLYGPIKPNDILFKRVAGGHNGKGKIIWKLGGSFEAAIPINSRGYRGTAKPVFDAPEIWQDEQAVTAKADVFHLFSLMAEVLQWVNFNKHIESMQVSPEELLEVLKVAGKHDVGEDWKDMKRKDPSKRPTLVAVNARLERRLRRNS